MLTTASAHRRNSRRSSSHTITANLDRWPSTAVVMVRLDQLKAYPRPARRAGPWAGRDPDRHCTIRMRRSTSGALKAGAARDVLGVWRLYRRGRSLGRLIELLHGLARTGFSSAARGTFRHHDAAPRVHLACDRGISRVQARDHRRARLRPEGGKGVRRSSRLQTLVGAGADHTPARQVRPDYRTGEKVAGIRSLFSCRTGRTPGCGGHALPGRRDSSRTRARSLRSLYAQMWTNLFSPPSSLVQQAANGENFSRASIALPHASNTFGMSPGE